MNKNITIVGAGLVGSLLSIYLAKRGHKVSLYERRPDMRKEDVSAGRSINLALSDRGLRGLEGVGIEDEIRKVMIPMYGRVIHNLNGEIAFQPYGKEGQAINSVSRGGLNCALMDVAEKNENLKIFFNERCTGIDLEKGITKIENQLSHQHNDIKSDLIFSADGAFSAARLQVQLSTNRFEYSQHYIEHGYKELNIPAGENGTWQMEKNALHIWPRGGYMLIALPNLDGSFTCTLFFPFEGKDSFESIINEIDLKEFFNRVFPDAVPLMPGLAHDYFSNPTGSLVTVKCFPWSYKDKLLLLGDAAHAIVPFFGQGMNCGFEDCTVLDQLMEEYGDNWQTIFNSFGHQRKPNSDAIAELALQNFIEMRDLVGDKKFLLRKKIEAAFSKKYPDKWIPLYSQVTFSHIPYAEAFRNGKKQDEIMKHIMSIQDIENKWDSEEVEKYILKLV